MAQESQKDDDAIKQFNDNVEKVDKKAIIQTVNNGLDKIKELDSNPPGALKELWEDIKLMVSVLRDYVSGSYRTIPWAAIAAIVGAIAYFACPIDAVYDYIPLFGFVDDAAVITFALSVIHKDLIQYKEWKENLEI